MLGHGSTVPGHRELGPKPTSPMVERSSGGFTLECWAFNPIFQGITINPHIPKVLSDVRTEVRLLGRHLMFQYMGSGDKLDSITVNGKPASGKLLWTDVDDGAEIVVVMDNT